MSDDFDGLTADEVEGVAKTILGCEATRRSNYDSWEAKAFTATFTFGVEDYYDGAGGPRYYAQVSVLNDYLEDTYSGEHHKHNRFHDDDLVTVLEAVASRYDELASWRNPPIPSALFDKALREGSSG